MDASATALIGLSFLLGCALIIVLCVIALAVLRLRPLVVVSAGIALVLVLAAGAIVAWIVGATVDPAEVLSR
ncbi:hypothetical protein [Microbacterium thalassium]|uniref:VIT1/CCC1 family predicted Fe2+/Mn2+ transporter n=1 Tax=Microbacterium thalassium TaxID=362649 RepID=A0A7X0KTD3_9MICO|nr:hypothetical protein [Microbacterium thalassium]MBB6390001.1 VIT1/CCC1 family predicted Fe2+/Mn2+ transporter [Microbacterium thalassium]GLK24687.1 hypothetical protein GCM10017607_20050 [Microbacterium thalassium]